MLDRACANVKWLPALSISLALWVLLIGLGFTVKAHAQSAPPFGANTTEATGTIATTGTYQQVFTASGNGGRKGCLIEASGSHNMLVYVGPSQPANSSGKGFVLLFPASTATGALPFFSCAMFGSIAVDSIWIEGTTGDTFEYAAQGN